MRSGCAHLGCTSFAIWEDVDTGTMFCGAHAVLVIDSGDDESKQKRADFADEYKRDADREARS